MVSLYSLSKKELVHIVTKLGVNKDLAEIHSKGWLIGFIQRKMRDEGLTKFDISTILYEQDVLLR